MPDMATDFGAKLGNLLRSPWVNGGMSVQKMALKAQNKGKSQAICGTRHTMIMSQHKVTEDASHCGSNKAQ